MKIFEYKNTKLSYEITGSGKTILFLHGWGLDHNMWSDAMEPVFSDVHEFRRVYIDLPGMGESVAGENLKSSDDTLELLYEFVKSVLGGEKIILAGQSYGGYLCRGFVHQYREIVDGIMLLCPLVFPGYRKGRFEPHLVKAKDEAFLKSLSKEDYDSFTMMNVILTKEVYERYSKSIDPALKKADWNFLSGFEGACSFNADEMEPFNGPALIVTGRQDTEVGFRDQFDLLKVYPEASYLVVNNAGHNLIIEQPEVFRTAVKEWLLKL